MVDRSNPNSCNLWRTLHAPCYHLHSASDTASGGDGDYSEAGRPHSVAIIPNTSSLGSTSHSSVFGLLVQFDRWPRGPVTVVRDHDTVALTPSSLLKNFSCLTGQPRIATTCKPPADNRWQLVPMHQARRSHHRCRVGYWPCQPCRSPPCSSPLLSDLPRLRRKSRTCAPQSR